VHALYVHLNIEKDAEAEQQNCQVFPWLPRWAVRMRGRSLSSMLTNIFFFHNDFMSRCRDTTK